MIFKPLADIDFANVLAEAFAETQTGVELINKYRQYMLKNESSCTLINNFLAEAKNCMFDNGVVSEVIEDLEKETKLYLYVGGKGKQCTGSTTAGGFNGGGAGYGNSSYICGSGGGGTDIRIGQDSLYARVIVAGGGGGAQSYNYPRAGSPGGGETGGQHCPNSSYYAFTL